MRTRRTDQVFSFRGACWGSTPEGTADNGVAMHPAYSALPASPVAAPPLPARLSGLSRLAYNFYWSWHPRVISLFKRVDAHTWGLARNPVPVLQARTDWSDLLDNPDCALTMRRLVTDPITGHLLQAWEDPDRERDRLAD